MREITGDLWDYCDVKETAIVITTNGFVKDSGEAVMGKGCALEAKARVPRIGFMLGKLLNAGGNHVYRIMDGLYSFPVKHNWWEKADIILIERSCRELSDTATEKRIVIPRMGCGNGKLKWGFVKPIVEKLLDDRFLVITFPPRDPYAS